MAKIQSYLYYIIQKSCLLVLYIELDISKEKLKFIEFMLYTNHVLEFIYIKMLVTPQPILKKEKEKKGIRFYGVTHAPPTCLFPTTYPYKISHSLLFGWPYLTLLSFLLFSHKHTNNALSLPHTSPPVPHYLPPSPPSFFRQDHRKNPQEPLSIFIHFI